MPVFIIVVWEIPIWLLVLAGLCVLGVSAYEYIPIICAVVTFLIALVSISVSASSTLEKRNAAQMDIYNCGVISCKFNDVFWYATLCSKGK